MDRKKRRAKRRIDGLLDQLRTAETSLERVQRLEEDAAIANRQRDEARNEARELRAMCCELAQQLEDSVATTRRLECQLAEATTELDASRTSCEDAIAAQLAAEMTAAAAGEDAEFGRKMRSKLVRRQLFAMQAISNRRALGFYKGSE